MNNNSQAPRLLNFGSDDEELQNSSPISKLNKTENMFSPSFEVSENEMDQARDDEGGVSPSSSEEETLEERRQREQEESLELARMLMAEEAMASYQHSVQYLRDSRDQLSQEDYQALEAALQEEEAEQEGAAVAELEDEEGNLSYETMLQLGERIGDVKSERWTVVAQKHIAKLPTEIFDSKKIKKDADDSESKCLVCQHEYECGENLRRLPCGHCFHMECVDQWLERTDLCPYCRTAIREES